MKTLKIKIEQQTNYAGYTYYYLTINDEFVKLDPDLAKIEETAQIATENFKAGKLERKVINETVIEL